MTCLSCQVGNFSLIPSNLITEENQKETADMASGEGEARRKKKVMVAIDESEYSHYALQWALNHLHDTVAASQPLIVFTVQPISVLAHIPAASYGSAPPELIRSLQEQQKRIALALLDQAKKICDEKGIIAETVTDVGEPKDVICEAVDRFNIDLLIMGSHGRGAIQRAFLGSVSNYCVHSAKCPVLIVKKSP